MPKLGWKPDKLIIHVSLWGTIKLYSKVNGQVLVWNRIQEARDFASKHGYDGVRLQ